MYRHPLCTHSSATPCNFPPPTHPMVQSSSNTCKALPAPSSPSHTPSIRHPPLPHLSSSFSKKTISTKLFSSRFLHPSFCVSRPTGRTGRYCKYSSLNSTRDTDVVIATNYSQNDGVWNESFSVLFLKCLLYRRSYHSHRLTRLLLKIRFGTNGAILYKQVPTLGKHMYL